MLTGEPLTDAQIAAMLKDLGRTPLGIRAERDFRDDANRVLRMVHERMQRENREFYPRIEAL